MNAIKNYLETTFTGSQLAPSQFDLKSDYHLRFDLGEGLKNGTKQRVAQSTQRAVHIFEALFKSDDDVWLVVNHCASDELNPLFGATEGYFEQQIQTDTSPQIWHQDEVVLEEPFEMTHENGTSEKVEPVLRFQQYMLQLKRSDIQYENIFRAIAHLEMGFEPAVEQRIYFINPRNDAVFFMYDDRGCLVFSPHKHVLLPLYQTYNHWLVDFYRPRFNQMFGVD